MKEEINTQIKRAEDNPDAHLAQFVKKRTLTRLNTIKSEAENFQAISDREDNDSDLIKQHVIDAHSDGQNSS